MPDKSASPAASPRPLLLIVDDDPLISDTLAYSLASSFEVLTSPSRTHCASLLRQLRQPPDLALVDLGLPPLPHQPDEGFALIGELLALSPAMRILVLSGQDGEAHGRHARTLGAVDFIAKPADPALLRQALLNSLTFREAAPADSSLLGHSEPMAKLRAQIHHYADSPFPVLIEGESGSGKEIVAHQLHLATGRSPPCSVTPRAPSPAPPAPAAAISRTRRTAPCFSTKSASCPWSCSPSCCGSWKTASSSGSAKPRAAAAMPVSSPPPTGT
jgi:two-component system nitrogen regulation response regulator GlnG